MEEVTRIRRSRAAGATAALVTALLGFGGPVPAEAAPSPSDEPAATPLVDGLQEVPHRGAGTFWVKPGVDLRPYNRVALKPISLQYKHEPQHYKIDLTSKGVLLTERDRERLQRAFYDAFKRGLARGAGFGPASEPNPGLLWVTASLVDVVVRHHREPSPDELSWVYDYGEMTLRVEFSDGETGELLARFEERRVIRPSADFLQNVFRRDMFPYWSAVRGNLSRWSELVRRRMHDQRAGAVHF